MNTHEADRLTLRHLIRDWWRERRFRRRVLEAEAQLLALREAYGNQSNGVLMVPGGLIDKIWLDGYPSPSPPEGVAPPVVGIAIEEARKGELIRIDFDKRERKDEQSG